MTSINLFNDGVELILRKSKELNIPSTCGLDVNDEKGFKEQGLALAFEHGAPDAIPAFFYWKYENWTPLIKKTYSCESRVKLLMRYMQQPIFQKRGQVILL